MLKKGGIIFSVFLKMEALFSLTPANTEKYRQDKGKHDTLHRKWVSLSERNVFLLEKTEQIEGIFKRQNG